ncbi:SRPBCC family protein [Streptomyces albidoflavus]|uniref:SRPBCC family protein n=1 Tax=Streptomyces albidoflavus TaxID=1886 RepID=UPI003452027F
MKTIETTVAVAVPLRTAYDQWTQFETFPRFMSGVRRVRQQTCGVSVWVVGAGPLRREFTVEILEQAPDSHLVWRTLGRGDLPRGEVRFRALADDSTEVGLRIELGGRNLAGVLGAVPAVAGRVLHRDLTRFRDFVEGLGEATAGWRGTIHDGHVQPGMPEEAKSPTPTWPMG